MVRETGLEPAHLAALAPKASVSTISPLARILSYFLMNGARSLRHCHNLTTNKFVISCDPASAWLLTQSRLPALQTATGSFHS